MSGAALGAALRRGPAAWWAALMQRWRPGDGRLPVATGVPVGQSDSVRWVGFDQALVWVVVGLLALGLVMVYSASVQLPDNPRFARYTPTYFLTRHAMFIVLAVVVAALTLKVPMRVWEKLAPWMFAGVLVLLALVLLPFIGKGVNGARRWIPLGILNFQPSELAKLAVTLYASNYMVRKMEIKETEKPVTHERIKPSKN